MQIFVTSRRAAAAEETAKAMQKTAELTEIGNIAERFKNAIEHLGNESAAVNLGGIYALHHIAQEVEGYRKRVFEILCAHIRETTTQMEYKTRETGSTEIKPTIEIQSILDLLFIKTQDQEIYKGLRGNLEGADLYGARLISANLQNANLRGANLQKVILLGAKLQQAILWDANLENADLSDANLENAILWRANLQNADLQGANLLDAVLRLTNLLDANLEKAKLQNADLREANLKNAHLQDANLQEANLEKAKLQKADLKEANLQEADLKEANLQEADLYQANLQEANLRGADLQYANLLEANLQYAVLRNADLMNVQNLKVEQLLKARTLYMAKLPFGMKEGIEEKKRELLEFPKDKQED